MSSKWPREWVEAASLWFVKMELAAQGKPVTKIEGERILDALSEVGALKEPEKPREWWICPNCHNVGDSDDNIHYRPDDKCIERKIHVREIVDED